MLPLFSLFCILILFIHYWKVFSIPFKAKSLGPKVLSSLLFVKVSNFQEFFFSYFHDYWNLNKSKGFFFPFANVIIKKLSLTMSAAALTRCWFYLFILFCLLVRVSLSLLPWLNSSVAVSLNFNLSGCLICQNKGKCLLEHKTFGKA